MAKLIIHLLLAIFLPPVAVFLLRGAGKELVADIILCIFMVVPGVLYAVYLTLKDHKVI